jgi:single-strand DNA-binding protein
MSVNKVILVGRLGSDPELRQTKSGFAVVNVRLATNERKKDGDQWVDHTEWHTVTMWGKLAENVSKFCSKGKQLYVEGRIQTRDFTDKNGVERKSTEIVADQVRFLGDRSDNERSVAAPTNGQSHQRVADADIPF